jgi:hypothetical protein
VTVGRGHDEVIIHSIGVVAWDREAYHTQRYIFPIGFKSERMYSSTTDAKKKVKYECEILDGGDFPLFRVVAEDRPGVVFEANSASGVWKKILDEIIVQGFGARTHASGPHLFGLSNLGVTKVIQELPGADRCAKYVKQRWIGDASDHHLGKRQQFRLYQILNAGDQADAAHIASAFNLGTYSESDMDD